MRVARNAAPGDTITIESPDRVVTSEVFAVSKPKGNRMYIYLQNGERVSLPPSYPVTIK